MVDKEKFIWSIESGSEARGRRKREERGRETHSNVGRLIKAIRGRR